MNPDAPKIPVNQNGPEPVAERWNVPMWLLVVFALLIYWGWLFLAQNAGGFDKDVYSPYHSSDEVAADNPQDPVRQLRMKGMVAFEKNCSPCHQSTGLGKEGSFPPLSGSEWVQAPKGDRLVRIVLNSVAGPIKVKGQDWNLSGMPRWGDLLKDDEIAAILTYIRGSWDNHAGPIDPALVKAARAESHPGPETSDELLKIPVQ